MVTVNGLVCNLKFKYILLQNEKYLFSYYISEYCPGTSFMIQKLLISIFTIGILSSCAGIYKTSNPAQFKYTTKRESGPLEYYYITNVFERLGAAKYKRKEKKKGVTMVAFKLVNTSSDTLSITENNFKISNQSRNVLPLSPLQFYNKVKQKSGFYFFWNFVPNGYNTYQSQVVNGRMILTSKFHFLPIGMSISLLNFFIAR
ncbi:MAG TPA: hypothetical protein VF691_21075, partial [Cytophagaceae bacterium]